MYTERYLEYMSFDLYPSLSWDHTDPGTVAARYPCTGHKYMLRDATFQHLAQIALIMTALGMTR